MQRECLQAVKKVEASNNALRKEQTAIAKAIKELEELIREGQRKSFTLKGSGYQVNDWKNAKLSLLFPLRHVRHYLDVFCWWVARQGGAEKICHLLSGSYKPRSNTRVNIFH